MQYDQIVAASDSGSLIARDGLSAMIWELALADQSGHESSSVWPSLPLSGQSAWLRDLWDQRALLAGRDRLAVLSGIQTDRLWREIIAASDATGSILGLSGIAAWSRDARAGLLAHGVAPEAIMAAVIDAETASFGTWNRRFQDRLASSGWIDPESLLYSLNRSEWQASTDDLLFLDQQELTPELERLIVRWRSERGSAEFLSWATGPAPTRQVICADPTDEISRAAEWAADKLGRTPQSRLALVVPDLSARVREIEEILVRQLNQDHVWHSHGQSVGSLAIFGAAVSAIRMLCGGGSFGSISRWLRSPYFGDSAVHATTAANLERVLRSDPRIQSGFLRAYQSDGLRELIASRLPAMVQRLDRALERIPRRATPTSWVQVWQDCLKALEWRGFDEALDDQLRNAWDRAWADFASLSVITGQLAPDQAIEEFERILASQRVYRTPGIAGLHLYTDLSSVGPGYAGVWVAGFDDQSWPSTGKRNPLLGSRVQATFGLDYLRPETSFVRAETELAALLARVPDAVFSCPAVSGDLPRTPNTRFGDWEVLSAEGARDRDNAVVARLGSREFEQVDDPAPVFDGDFIPRGVRTLDLQSRCPAIAFAVARLEAEPLEPPVHGIGPRLRGNFIHRALELLFNESNPAAGQADASVDAAAEQLCPPGDARWQALVRAEKLRTSSLLQQFLEAESRRSDHSVARSEFRFDTRVGSHAIRCRLDRLDRLGSGSHLLIDYKTGRTSISGWFSDRLQDCQLPLYAIGLTEPVAGIAVIALNDEGVRYQSVGTSVADLPGRPVQLDEDQWSRQLDLWQQQIQALVEEFAGGDVRVSTAALARSDRHFAALIRSYELAADV